MNFNWQDYALINNEVEAVKQLIIDEIGKFPKYIKAPLLELVLANAKYLRSGFFILCSKFGEKADVLRIRKLAAAIELFHLATLVHDDVIDDAAMRRNKPALHIECGRRISILTGDFLFIKCYELISKHIDLPLVERLSALGLRICTGEIKQAEYLFDKRVSVRQYLKRISGKTAALFAFCFYLGAMEGGLPGAMQTLLGKTGYTFGICFQIIDDILDFTKKSQDIGKTVQNDLKMGIYTLPVIYALKTDNARLNALIDRRVYNGSSLKKIIRLVAACNGIDDSLKLAEKYTSRALMYAGELPASEFKNILIEVLKNLLKRDY